MAQQHHHGGLSQHSKRYSCTKKTDYRGTPPISHTQTSRATTNPSQIGIRTIVWSHACQLRHYTSPVKTLPSRGQQVSPSHHKLSSIPFTAGQNSTTVVLQQQRLLCDKRIETGCDEPPCTQRPLRTCCEIPMHPASHQIQL